jgi:hypothetical protein
MTERQSSIPPLIVEFEVQASPEHAFDTWVRRAAMWWPRGHTMTADPVAIVFEPRVGGRIYEVGPAGEEHPWGEVVAWDRPGRVEYLWHLFFPKSQATRVVVTFEGAAHFTRVRIEQTGWDELGDAAVVRRHRTVVGWGAAVSEYCRFLTELSNNQGADNAAD